MRRRSARTEARPRRRPRALAAAAALVLASAFDAHGPAHAQDTALRDALSAFGPWPDAAAPASASAPAANAAVLLGERLFFSPRLGTGGVRCASCHEPWRGFVDGRAHALGVAEGPRNTPSLLDVARHRRFGWDGARDELAAQALRPLADANEMPASAAHVAGLVRDDPALAARYAEAFGTSPGTQDDAQVLHDAGSALAAYVATLASPRTPFDAWRDEIVAGGASASPPSAAAARGFALFTGAGGCAGCHAGPAFSDDAMHASRVRSPGAAGAADAARGDAFRTPGLRGVAATAPYMHDGSIASLCDAVRPHAQGQPEALDAAQRGDLVAFLSTLQAAPPATDADCAP